MDNSQVIEKMVEFFKLHYLSELKKIESNLQSRIEIDFSLLSQFDVYLADFCLDDPDDFLELSGIALVSGSGAGNPYMGSLGNSPSVPPVPQFLQVHEVPQNIQIPSFIQNQSQKVLWLLSVVKQATQKEIRDFFNIPKSTLSQIFERSDRNEGLVPQGWGTQWGTQNGELTFCITDEGRKYLQRLESHFNEQYQKKDSEKIDLRIGIFNLPESNKLSLCDVRVEHLDKLLSIEAVIRNKTAVLPRTALSKYECPACGQVIRVDQVDPVHYKEPSRCSCGRKGRFKLLRQTLRDTQKLTLEDLQSNIELGKEVARLRGVLQDELCLRQDQLKVSNRVLFVCIPRKIQREIAGQKTVDFDIFLEILHFKNLDHTDVVITPADELIIKDYSASQGCNLLNDLSCKFVPNITGNDHIKKALLLQHVSKDSQGFKYRLRLNIHLFGRPGIGKTDLAMGSHRVCFKSAYVDAAKASSVGLTAAAIKDEFLKQWVLEAGALVLAGNGIAVLDELDKLKDEMTANDLGEPMEKGSISIHKANIHDTLQVSARVLGIGNISEDYESGVVDSKVLRLKHHLIDRFDLLLKAEDVEICYLTQKLLLCGQEDSEENDEFLRKYLFYAFNMEVSTELAPEVYSCLSDFITAAFITCRSHGLAPSPRFIQSLYRLTLASAKIRLSKNADLFDAKVAISLLKRSFEDRGVIFPEEMKIR